MVLSGTTLGPAQVSLVKSHAAAAVEIEHGYAQPLEAAPAPTSLFLNGIGRTVAQEPLVKPHAAAAVEIEQGDAAEALEAAPASKPQLDAVSTPAPQRDAAASSSPQIEYPAIIGKPEVHVMQRKETLIGLSRDHQLGLLEVLAVNPGVDPWVPGVGTVIVLPKAHLRPSGEAQGIIVNLAELRIYYFPEDGSEVFTSAIGVGREAFTTPMGETTIVRKKAGPTWTPTAATRADDPTLPPSIGPGPKNPLGAHALYLGWPTYLIHGTNKPPGVGRRVSRGCIRMYPESVETLFGRVPVGAKVRVVSEPVKMGWENGELYIEVHPTHDQLDQLEKEWNFDPNPVTNMDQTIVDAAGLEAWRLDWGLVRAALRERRGIPIQVTRAVSDEMMRYVSPRTMSY